MSFEQKDFTGALFANDKGGNDKRPDCRGSAKVNGVEYQLSGWWRVPKNGGKKYLAVIFDTPYEKEKIAQPSGRSKLLEIDAAPADLDDSIPF